VVEATAKYRVLSIRFEGNKAYVAHRLLKEIKTAHNASLDERQVKEDMGKILEYYQKNGYNQAQVSYTIDRNRSTGFGTITFKIREGEKVKITSIKFIGNDHIKAKRLKKKMDTAVWTMFSWLTGGGRLKNDEFDDDLDKLRDFYRDQGYLDVEIAEDKVTFDYPTHGKLAITIRIKEGRQYHIGTITFSGNKLYTAPLLDLMLRQKSGMVFRPTKLDKDVEMVENFYGRDGHLETHVQMVRKPNMQTGNIDVEYKIEEGDKYQVESIKIEGNTKTKSTVILRELVLGPGDVFDKVRMKISQARLENTRFFEEQSVNVTDETSNIPGRKNMKVNIKEGRTGNLTFGAGFSSLEKASVFAEVTQSNFDIANPHSFFQGAGQKFRIRLQLGTQSSEAIIAFDEPWAFERELDMGFQLFRSTSNYTSSYYEEIRTGATISVRKRLFGLVEGSLNYTWEIVGIKNVVTTAPLQIQELAGNTTVSKLGFTLVRDTRNKVINTSKGAYVAFTTELAGGPLGGDENYYKFDLHTSTFLPVFAAQNQVLALVARAGVVNSFGKSNDFQTRNGITFQPLVPLYDRFFLGGQDDLRGFEYRTVGPIDPTGQTAEPIGGDTYGMFTAEYSMDVVKPVRFAIFYDIGFVNTKAYDFNPQGFNDDFGFGLRLMVAGAPLSLDYGLPLTGTRYFPGTSAAYTNKKGGQFNFTFGTRF